jgi:hypothetical protein
MRNPTYGLVVTGVVLALILAAPAAEAQQDPTAVRHRNDCRLAHQVLTHGQPANRYDWARSVITGCGELGGAALAALIGRHRAEAADTSHFETIVITASMLRDGQIYEAALDVVLDQGASTLARVQAARILYNQLFSGIFVSYDDIVFETTMDGGKTRLPLVSTAHIPAGRPLPVDALEKAADVLAPLTEDGSLPRDLRIAVQNVAGDIDFRLLLRRLCGDLDPDGPECSRLLSQWFDEEYGVPEPDDDDDDQEYPGIVLLQEEEWCFGG